MYGCAGLPFPSLFAAAYAPLPQAVPRADEPTPAPPVEDEIPF